MNGNENPDDIVTKSRESNTWSPLMNPNEITHVRRSSDHWMWSRLSPPAGCWRGAVWRHVVFIWQWKIEGNKDGRGKSNPPPPPRINLWVNRGIRTQLRGDLWCRESGHHRRVGNGGTNGGVRSEWGKHGWEVGQIGSILGSSAPGETLFIPGGPGRGPRPPHQKTYVPHTGDRSRCCVFGWQRRPPPIFPHGPAPRRFGGIGLGSRQRRYRMQVWATCRSTDIYARRCCWCGSGKRWIRPDGNSTKISSDNTRHGRCQVVESPFHTRRIWGRHSAFCGCCMIQIESYTPPPYPSIYPSLYKPQYSKIWQTNVFPPPPSLHLPYLRTGPPSSFHPCTAVPSTLDALCPMDTVPYRTLPLPKLFTSSLGTLYQLYTWEIIRS